MPGATYDRAAGAIVTPLVLRHLGGRRYQVHQDFTYVTRRGAVVTVPAGFVSDGGSVPWFLWSFYPPFGSDFDEGYVAHDYLYAHAERRTPDDQAFQFVGTDVGHISRGEADALMNEIHEVTGARSTGRPVVFAGVRVGGWHAWGAHRRKRRQEAAAHRPCPCCYPSLV